ncbi:Stress response protein nst1 [Bienertia sinuspersici]
MMQAIAKGIGNTPVNMMIGEESLWLKIHEFEAARIMKEKEEEKRRNEEEEKRRNEEEKKKNEEVKKKMIKEEEREREREINGTPKKVEVMGVKKKKKNMLLVSPEVSEIQRKGDNIELKEEVFQTFTEQIEGQET